MRIGIIGAGVSGLVAAYKLGEQHEVTLYEANGYAGGHVNTVDVEAEGVCHAVDTGFIVFNEATYPHFSALLRELDVASSPTSMSFSVVDAATGYEYGSRTLSALFAQPRNIVDPAHLRMLADVLRFNHVSQAEFATLTDEATVGQFCERHRLSRYFVDRYLHPMGSAIWSCPRGAFQQFPVKFIIQFFQQHGLLALRNRPQWRVVDGGSRTYVEALTRGFRDRIRFGSAVVRVSRSADRVALTLEGGESRSFDHVIFACHSDQALRILGNDATCVELEILSAFPYQRNRAVLHTDETLLPRSPRAWASWNYRICKEDAATVTYNMNLLQGIESPRTYCVTLNDSGEINPSSVIRTFDYAHPVFTSNRTAAQARHRELLDANRTSFCGAYWRNGFHEDGVVSALSVVEALQSRLGSVPQCVVADAPETLVAEHS
ncbi:NAD(P)/FAD-dependent oxidoreductase [Lacipirellula parvula]|uniref:Amine oxidase n=1 Tax=Lacipirellula parvula TaxID=2650471 RepID=A0A5K7XDR0_9BACT|nr:FAD-dependent oxidoreductase [Lacipirellula parvula]BBO34618.1 amine oxidase [Lacipirellula parvula]